MWNAVRLLVCAALLWQAVDSVVSAIGWMHSGLAVGPRARFVASTDERLQRALGGDADVLIALRAAAPADTMLVTQKIVGRVEDFTPAQLLLLAHKNHLIGQLTVLLYPDPWIVSAPEPMPFVEQQTRRGARTALLWLPGDQRPSAAGDWRAVHTAPGFEIWQPRTD
ncbi:MAG TPA: hypothetical protein VFZ65_14505 [Planctomycetota bacterium]|nr:hypothetical protein [Planctomycetota bacterium]